MWLILPKQVLCNETSREITVVDTYLFNDDAMNAIFWHELVATSSVTLE